MKPLIFSVEDDKNIQNVIQIALKNSQFDIVSFYDAKSMFNALEEKTPDLFLLDIMLPDIDGLEIIRRIKKINKLKQIPIMVISAKTTEVDKVIGLDYGADDYLAKPFGVLELVARVKALLRRHSQDSQGESINLSGLCLNILNHEVVYNNQTLEFTKKQFDLLKYFMEKHNKVITREELLNNVWGFDFLGETRTLDMHVKEIRRKLRESGIKEEPIETIRGIGYKFVL